MIITIAGPAGSGKGTVAKILAKRLGYDYYSTGDFRRMAAKKRGLTLEEFNMLGESDPSTDKDADDFQKKLGFERDNFIIDGRLGWYFIPHSVKIFLDVNDDVSAERVFNDQNNSSRINQTKTSSVMEQKELSVKRNLSDKKRYEQIYGIKNFIDPKNYDLVIDTSKISITDVVDKIINFLNSKN